MKDIINLINNMDVSSEVKQSLEGLREGLTSEELEPIIEKFQAVPIEHWNYYVVDVDYLLNAMWTIKSIKEKYEN